MQVVQAYIYVNRFSFRTLTEHLTGKPLDFLRQMSSQPKRSL